VPVLSSVPVFHSVIDKLFSCSHRNTTFPMTPRKGLGTIRQTYVSCLDCGQELAYDWSRMRLDGPLRREHDPLASRVRLGPGLAQKVHHTLAQHPR
jgi:hypothetical protein